MRTFELTYHPYGPNALIVQWPKKIDEEILNDLLAFKTLLLKALPQYFCTVAYCELMLFSNQPMEDRISLMSQLKELYPQRNKLKLLRNHIRIPVCYDVDYGWDQIEVCEDLGISREELILLHTEAVYTVYAIGFLPGFMYLGGLPDSLSHPRKEVPRSMVPEGAVGIAGMQTGIYPQESPGGWQLIGSCPIKLFNVKNQPPVIAAVGDRVQFFSISKGEYELYKLQEAAGVFELDKQIII